LKHPLNAVAVVTVIAASCALAWVGNAPQESNVEVARAGFLTAEQLPEVVDHGGHPVPCLDYQRIVCASTIAAEVAPELVSVDRILMVPAWHRESSPSSFKTELRGPNGEPRIKVLDSLASVEVLVGAKPDLILLSSLVGGGGEHLQRLRSLGLTVLDLGPMLGVDSFLSNIQTLGQVLRVPGRGHHLARSFLHRLQRVKLSSKGLGPKRALYIGSMGGSLMGGTEGSSYHDLLSFAGLEDVAAGRGLSPWPTYSPEQVLDMAPDLIVTEHGQGASLKATPGFDQLSALARPGGLVELPEGSDTIGLGLLDAVEALHEAVYGYPVEQDGERP